MTGHQGIRVNAFLNLGEEIEFGRQNCGFRQFVLGSYFAIPTTQP